MFRDECEEDKEGYKIKEGKRLCFQEEKCAI